MTARTRAQQAHQDAAELIVFADGIPARDDLLRATVYAAIDARAYDPDTFTVTDDYRAALEQIIFVHRTWPLIEYAHALKQAAEMVDAAEQAAETELLAWYAGIRYGRRETRVAA